MKKNVLIAALGLIALSLQAQTYVDITPASFVQGVANFSSSASGDINGDGKLDIIVTGDKAGRNTWIYLNDGSGGFTLSTNSGINTGFIWSYVGLGDYDADGDLDMAMQGYESAGVQAAYIYQNNGAGVFTKVATLRGRSNGNIEFGDYNNDGKLDILQTGWQTATPAGGYTTIYRNDGNNVFTEITSTIRNIADGQAKWADLNKDGKLDIVLEGWNATEIYLGDGLGAFTLKANTLPKYDNSFVNVIDYDKDGNLDLLFGGHVPGSSPAAYGTKVAKGDGAGNFSLMNFGLTDVQRGPVAIGDCNNDGFNDFFICGWNGAGAFQIFKNDGTNNAFAAVSGINTVIPGWADGTMQVKDFNGDGYDEVFKCGWNVTGLYTNNQSRGYFRSKNTGNWNDISVWERSTNNVDWVSATSFPTEYATTTDILNSHLITITDKAIVTTLNINSGGKLTLSSGKALTVGILNLKSDDTGTATYVDNGGTTNITTANVQQYLASSRNWYVSSPVTNATSPANNISRYYEYVEAGNNGDLSVTGSTIYWKGLTTVNPMAIGKGYIAQVSAGTTVEFSGIPNNGNITTTFDLTRDDAKGKGFNLVGNPYPSYIDWSLVAAANTNLSKTFYFRSKNTNETSTYTFASYNGLLDEVVSSNGTPNTTITRFIPPTQAFWIRVNTGTSTTKMYFNNNMRAHRDDNGNLFKAPKAEKRMRLRLQLVNGSEADETLICTDVNTDNGFDMYDSPKMMNNSSVTPDLYTKADAERLVINGLNTIYDNMELPLGFSLNAAATLKLKATEISNFPTGTRIYLLDKVENKQTELTPETEYSFGTTTTTLNNDSRFSLLFRTPGNVTNLKNAEKLNAQIFVNRANHIVIESPERANVTISNAMGQKLFKNILTSTNTTINKTFYAGVYFVELSINGQRVIQKVYIP